jgi:glycerophosphoryl diester phosphodiesterase
MLTVQTESETMLFKTNTIVGHRGCSLVDQNNTVEAFLKAVHCGAEMVEMDVRRTRDGVLVVRHDADIDGLRLRGYSYAELAERANEAGLVLPTLDHVLESLEGQVQLDVELKEAGYEAEVVSKILQRFTPNEFVITSFLDQAVLAVKKHFPTVKCGLILGVSRLNSEFSWGGLRRVSQRISEFFPWRRIALCRADFIAVNWRNLLFGLLRSAKKRRVPVLVWTVNDPPKMRKLLETRLLAALATDRPDLAVAERKRLS